MTSNEKANAVLNALAPMCPQCGKPTRIVQDAFYNIGEQREACMPCARWIWTSIAEAAAVINTDMLEVHRKVALFRDEF